VEAELKANYPNSNIKLIKGSGGIFFAAKLETAETVGGVALNMHAPYFYPTSPNRWLRAP